jgi:hypothetical protein
MRPAPPTIVTGAPGSGHIILVRLAPAVGRRLGSGVNEFGGLGLDRAAIATALRG